MSFGKLSFFTSGKVSKSGISSKTQKPYFMVEAFLEIPGIEWPQKFEYYCQSQSEILSPGKYECTVDLDLSDGRPYFKYDLLKSRLISSPSSSSAPITRTA